VPVSLSGGAGDAVAAPALEVQAGSTGMGPATDADCQNYADLINRAWGTAQQELNDNGNGVNYNEDVDAARDAQDQAEDAGCFLVNPG
jgi:hypothetical protein